MKRLYNLIPIKKSLGKNDQKKLFEEAHVSFVIFGVKAANFSSDQFIVMADFVKILLLFSIVSIRTN